MKFKHLFIFTTLSSPFFQEVQSQEDYRGKFNPDASYVLSGQLARDLPPLPYVPYFYDEEGFHKERLSKVPAVGVHPRVVMSPSDINDIRNKIKSGEKAGKNFAIVYRELQNRAAQKVEIPKSYKISPWEGLSIPASKALLALIHQDNPLGREAVTEIMEHAQHLEKVADVLNNHPETQPYKDNFFYFARTPLIKTDNGFMFSSELCNGTEDGQFDMVQLGMEYDYGYNFMTKEEREYVRSVISKLTYGKYTTGMEMPGHMFINNHQNCAMQFINLVLAIEGEKGYDARILKEFYPRMVDHLTYNISPAGYIYERIKGYVPRAPLLALARRGDRKLMSHSHLKAWIYAQFQDAEYNYNRYVKRDFQLENSSRLQHLANEERYWDMLSMTGPVTSTGFASFWMMKHFYPEDPVIDFVFKVRNKNANFDHFTGAAGEVYNRKLLFCKPWM
ncbi:MAG: hypothetical protein LUE93_17035 [Bacteroides sp.]|nr:hypothetical protein [Bacteroides sp.]